MTDQELKDHIAENSKEIDQGFVDYYELDNDELKLFQENRFVIIRLLQQRKEAIENDEYINEMLYDIQSCKIDIPDFEGDKVDDKLQAMRTWATIFQPNRSFKLQEIGTAVGLTRERVRQIEAKALKKLRHDKNMKVFNECR